MSSKNQKGGSVLGFEYEILVPAYFSLILDNDETIEDFCFRTNESSFGKLDDLVIETRTKKGEKINFAMQFKHREKNNKTITPHSLTKGKISLETYCASFKKLTEENQKYNFIIYTNGAFDKAKMNEIKQFTMSERESEFPGNIFNTSLDKRNVYKFEPNENTPESDEVKKEDYEKFLPRLSLFVCQKNVRQFEEEIRNFLKKDVSNADVWLKYVHLFRLWRQKAFTSDRIDKAVVNYHLMDAFLWPHVVKNYRFSNDDRLRLFKNAIDEFDVTVIRESMTTFREKLEKCDILDFENDPLGVKNSLKSHMSDFNIDVNIDNNPENPAIDKCLLRLAQKFNFSTRTSNNLQEDKVKLLHFFCQKMLLVDFNENSESSVLKILQTCHMRNIKIILIGVGEINRKKFPKLRLMEHLVDLNAVNQNLFKEILSDGNINLNFTSQEFENWLMRNSIIGNYDTYSDYVYLQIHLNFFRKILKGYSISNDADKLKTEEFYQKLINDKFIKEEKSCIYLTLKRSELNIILEKFLCKVRMGGLFTTKDIYDIFKYGPSTQNVRIRSVVLLFLKEFLLKFFKLMVKKYEIVCSVPPYLTSFKALL